MARCGVPSKVPADSRGVPGPRFKKTNHPDRCAFHIDLSGEGGPLVAELRK